MGKDRAVNWEKVCRVAKAIWKVIRIPILAIIGVAAMRYIYKARKGIVGKSRQFQPVPGDPTRIDVLTDEGWKRVKLPGDVRSEDVRAAGLSDQEFVVEIKHEVTDRRGDPAAGRDSDLGL